MRRKREEKAKEKDSRSEKSSREMGNLGQERRGNKVRRRSKETGPREISSVD